MPRLGKSELDPAPGVAASAGWRRRLGEAVAAAGTWLSRLAEAGTGGYPPETKRRLMILNMIAYLIVVTTLVYALQQMFLDHDRYWPIIAINLAIVVLVAAVPFMHRFGSIAAALLILVTEYVALFAFTSYLGRESGLHIQYIAFSAGAFVVLGLGRLWLIIPVITAGLALHLACWFWFPQLEAAIPAPQEVLDSLYIQAAITTFGIISAAVYYAFRLVENAKAETEALLRNILPDTVVERLKAKPAEPVADTFAEASILFADISGFVPLARRLGAGETVAVLNRLVSTFDELAELHGIEKIKTIGDAYMAASGVPLPTPDFALRLARMALAMQEAVARLSADTGYDITMRMGMATGPVMAGVIGRQKFSYDIWGDAVNLAARLESTSLPGRIHLCPTSREKLGGEVEVEARGSIDIKGVGAQSTWFLVAARLSQPSSPPRVGEVGRGGTRNASDGSLPIPTPSQGRGD